MHFLFTGPISNMTDRDYNVNRSRLKVRTTTDGLIAALEEMGHKVTARPVIPGEDLSEFDQAIIGMAGFYSNLAFYTCGTLWALHKFPNALLTVNDWRVLDALKMCNSKPSNDNYFTNLINERNQAMSQSNKVEDYASYANKHMDIIMETRDKFSKATDQRVIFPAYPGWKRDKLRTPNPVFRWNPSEFMPQKNYSSYSLFGKENAHVISAASTPDWKWYKNLDESWDSLESIKANSKWKIHAYGPWNNNGIPEEELTSIISESRTCLVPSYKQISGVGMWRPRYAICANVETLVLCDKEEGAFMGPGFGEHTAKEIEAMTESQLDDLVCLQKETFMKTIESKEQVFEQLKLAIGE